MKDKTWDYLMCKFVQTVLEKYMKFEANSERFSNNTFYCKIRLKVQI